MRLFLLSLLAIGSVHSLTIGYPYRSALLAYSPGRGQFPVQSAEVQGYLRYVDSNGVEHLVSYSHPEPTLGVRQVAGISSPVVRSYNIDPATYPKAIEGHFRAWVTVQYKALRNEIDALKAQGKEPSADILNRLQPLEKIYQTADFSTIAELPDVKRLFDEHSRIYKVKTEFLQQPSGEVKTFATSNNIPLVAIGQTLEQQLAREEHLRIYNEQVARLRQLEAQREETIKEASTKSQIGQTKISEQEPINRLAGQADEISEVERATQEHLRLWNEAKLRAEKTNNQDSDKSQPQLIDGNFREWIAEKYKTLRNQIDALKALGKEPSADMFVKLQPLEKIYQTADFSSIAELPEVKRLFDEHSRAYKVKTEDLQQPKGEMKILTFGANEPLVSVVETPEQKLAREEHLRIYNEHIARLEGQREGSIKETSKLAQAGQTEIVEQQPMNRLGSQSESITEVERATQEHLRLWNEAKLRAEMANNQQEIITKQSESKNGEPKANKEVIAETVQNHQTVVAEPDEILKARAEHLRLVNEATNRVQSAHKVQNTEQVKVFTAVDEQPNFQLRSSIPVTHQQQHSAVDNSEVVGQHEHHLRVANEANSRGHSIEEDKLKHKEVFEAFPHPSIYTQASNAANAVQPVVIFDTPEVTKAREEHFRLINEAQRRVHTIEEPQYVKHDQSHIAETPEVLKARQEHLRIFNEIKTQAEQEQAKLAQVKASGTELKAEDFETIQEQERLEEEARLLELDRIREAMLLALEQEREAERLAEEKRQMEAEIKRLQREEEQRLKLESLLIERSLKTEQEQQAQQIIITQEFKPSEGQTQQPAIISDTLLKAGQTSQQQLAQQQPIQQQLYASNPFLKSPTIEGEIIQPQEQPSNFPSESRKIPSSQNSIGTKQQHIKDDFIKHQTIDHAGYQPADTAAVLIHLEMARQEHFRAHDQVLEQLRLARLQSSVHKDCN